MTSPITNRIAPEVFEQAKRDAVAARQAAMKELVAGLWRIMTAPLSPAATRSARAGTRAKPCFPY
jgi:hypothetical protein